MRAAIQIRGSRDITFRNNTISGDLPSIAYAIRISRQELNPLNKNIHLSVNTNGNIQSTLIAPHTLEVNSNRSLDSPDPYRQLCLTYLI